MTEDWEGDKLMTILLHCSRAFWEFRYGNTDLENSQKL